MDIVKNPPNAVLVEKWLTESSVPLKRFFNTSGIKYRELGLKEQVDQFSVSEAAETLANDGMLIKRPILTKDDHFLVNGFKEDAYKEVL